MSLAAIPAQCRDRLDHHARSLSTYSGDARTTPPRMPSAAPHYLQDVLTGALRRHPPATAPVLSTCSYAAAHTAGRLSKSPRSPMGRVLANKRQVLQRRTQNQVSRRWGRNQRYYPPSLKYATFLLPSLGSRTARTACTRINTANEKINTPCINYAAHTLKLNNYLSQICIIVFFLIVFSFYCSSATPSPG